MTDDRPPQTIPQIRIHVNEVLTACDAIMGWLKSNEPVKAYIAMRNTIDELRIIEKDLEALKND